MLISVGDFRRRVAQELPILVQDLQEHTGRRGTDEADSWRASLPVLANVLSASSMSALHLYLGDGGRLSVEYRLPASSSWCDVVLLGRHHDQPCAVIVELKHWRLTSDKAGPVEGVVLHNGEYRQHPSDQVRGYTEYCRRFHSAVLDARAAVHGLVLFTQDRNFGVYRDAPNDRLFESFPCFFATEHGVDEAFTRYLADRISGPDPEFASAFETGLYRQDRGFVQQVGRQVLSPAASPFVLLEEQQLGFALCKSNIDQAIFNETRKAKKTVVIISGPPGSGKSVIAAHLWAHLVNDPRMAAENFVLTSTSKAQETNWKALFRRFGGPGAPGVVVPANKYAPLTTTELGQFQHRHPGSFVDCSEWRQSLNILRNLGHRFRMPDDHVSVSIVDEAHALLNPEQSDARGATGWPSLIGPQAYHIIRSSTVSVFLLDEEQRFRERENTSVDDIETWAKELDADVVPMISLHGRQFRCAGSKEYVEWVESVLAGEPAARCAEGSTAWLGGYRAAPAAAAEPPALYGVSHETTHSTGDLTFEVVGDVWELEASLRDTQKRGRSTRLLASYAREWVTEGNAHPRRLPAALQDFQISNLSGDRQVWARPWNVIRNGDYSTFVQAPEGSDMASDPLGEVGCPYAVRGFDFDYVGLLWLSDLVWRGDRWRVNPEQVHESGISRVRNRARRETDLDGPHHKELLRRVRQAYRILLTRAMRGVFVWCEDEETRIHLQDCLAHKQGDYV